MIQTLNFLTKTPMPTDTAFTLSSELINELLRSMRLRGVQYRRIQAGPVFGIGFAAKPGHAYFHFLAAGCATLRMEDGSLFELSAGNAVFIAHGGAHALSSQPDAPVQDIASFNAASLGDTVCAVNASPDEPANNLLFSACMEFELDSIQGLGNLMPALMLIDAGGQRYPGLMPILAVMEREVSSARIGYAGILARLADVVAAMIVRGWVECACANASGLAAALRDNRLAGALLALHQQPVPRLERGRAGGAVSYLAFGVRGPFPSHLGGATAALRNRTAHAPGQSMVDLGAPAHRRGGVPPGVYLTGRFQSRL